VSPFSANDVNNWTVSAYNLPNTTPIPVTLYGSLIDKASAPPIGNSSGATDPGAIAGGNAPEGLSPCAQTTTFSSKCIIWKADLQLPSLASSLAENITSTNSLGVDNGTDVFVDLHYDITTAVGNIDPVGRSSGSVHSLNEVATTFTSGGAKPSGCSYESPLQGQCFNNNISSIDFEFDCPGVPFSQFVNLQNPPGPPLISIVKVFPQNQQTGIKPSPQPIMLTSTSSRAPYKFVGNESYLFKWSPKGMAGTFRGCTFDPTKTLQPFCVDFSLNPACRL
jgi:hypothetical protein